MTKLAALLCAGLALVTAVETPEDSDNLLKEDLFSPRYYLGADEKIQEVCTVTRRNDLFNAFENVIIKF